MKKYYRQKLPQSTPAKPSANDAEVQLLIKWRKQADLYVSECMGVNEANGFRATRNQQVPALKAISQLALVKGIVSDFDKGIKNAWVEREGPPTPEMREMSKKLGVSVMAGRNTGKDTFASWVGFWFLTMHNASRTKIACFAPTQSQLKTVLWSEFALWHGMNAKTTGLPMFQMQNDVAVEAEKIYIRGPKNEGKTGFICHRTPQKNVDKEQMKKTLSGLHADNLLFIMDEASGIDDAIMEECELTMMGRKNLMLQIGNPHKPYGYFYDSHFGKHSDKWLRFHWDSEECELVSKQHILNLEERYGRDSDAFRVNVKGLPPTGGDDAFIPYQWIIEACEREMSVPKDTAIVMGYDPAGSGRDSAFLTVRQGGKILGVHRIDSPDNFAQEDAILRLIKVDYIDYRLASVCVETDGLGKDIYERLSRSLPGKVRPVQMGKRLAHGRFYNNRVKLWHSLRKSFEAGLIDIPNIRELREELSTIQSLNNDSGDLLMISKAVIRKKLGRSSDRADSLVMTFAVDDVIASPTSEKERDFYNRERHKVEYQGYTGSNSFMGV